jgi:hypothetical protein
MFPKKNPLPQRDPQVDDWVREVPKAIPSWMMQQVDRYHSAFFRLGQ